MNRDLYIGVDIGGTTVKIAFITSEGDMVHKWEIPTRKENGAESVPSDIWNSIDEKLTELSIDKKQVQGIGAGAPGFIDTESGIVTEAVNVGWKNFDLAGQLRSLSGVPVYINNDANIAALGENWKGSGNLAQNLIAITLGTGVGGGIVANSQIINGESGTAGEIGHIAVEPGGAPCNCGKRGCLETIASATGMVRIASEYIQSGENTLLKERYDQNGEITTKDIFEVAKQNDAVALKIIDRITDVLGLAIANAATLTNPSKIVIGGGVSKAGDDLLNPLKKAFSQYALKRINDSCEFVIAQLGNDAGVYGGAYLVKEELKG